MQYYTKRDTNIYVKDGLLHIRALKEDYKTRHYTSAKIVSQGKADFKFGRMEIRARIPVGKGLWPAIWMMPSSDKYGSWPLSGEIDIMEIKGQEPDSLYGTIHFGPAAPNNRHKGTIEVRPAKNGWGDAFHVYAISWQKNKIAWFADGKKYFEATDKDVANMPGVPYPFNEPFYFILNLAIGGGFVVHPDDAVFPKEFLVDYIKVWQ